MPAVVPTTQLTATATLTAALVGLAALLPGKVLPAAAGMIAPFLSQGLMWLGSEWAKEWLAERKVQAPTRRAERYLRQMNRQLRKMKSSDAQRAALELKITQLSDRLHEHKLNELELKVAVVTQEPPKSA